VSGWNLTIRHGSDVEREQFDSLEQTIEEMRKRVEAIRAEGPLAKVSMPRDYEASDQVHARLEISSGGLLRGRDAGLDVMGDGTLVPYMGGIRRTQLELQDGQNPFEAVGEALTAASR
jgi:hypothetical protein